MLTTKLRNQQTDVSWQGEVVGTIHMNLGNGDVPYYSFTDNREWYLNLYSLNCDYGISGDNFTPNYETLRESVKSWCIREGLRNHLRNLDSK